MPSLGGGVPGLIDSIRRFLAAAADEFESFGEWLPRIRNYPY